MGAKLPVLSGRELVCAFAKAGWETARQRGSHIILFAFALLCAAVPLRAQSNVGESAAFAFDTRDYTTGLAAESASFAFDTRIVDGLSGAGVSVSFAFDTRGATLPPLQVAGILRDSSGVPVAGATIQIKRGNAIFWQGTSGVGGTLTAPNLSGVNYTVIVTKTGYVTSVTNITGTSGGALSLNLQSAAMPGVLTVQDISRDIASGALGVVAPGSFQVFDGSNFVSALAHPPDLSRDTLVLTHGWNSDPSVWARLMALQIQSRLGAGTPNIIAWDWRTDAAAAIPPIDRSPPQGLLLGQALQATFGTNYQHHVHFIGHSLGTIVNKYACDYVHGMLNRGNPAAAWNKEVTLPQITLLDEAEAASVLGNKVVTKTALAWAFSNTASAIATAITEAKQDWKNPIPRSAKWIDNYISAFGIQHEEAVNVCLLAPTVGQAAATWTLGGLDTAHAYAHLWFRNTISPSGTAPVVGFGSSKWIAPVFPPTYPANGSVWYENLATTDPLDLTSDPSVLAAIGIPISNCSFPAFTVVPILAAGTASSLADAAGNAVISGYHTGVQWVQSTASNVVHKVGAVTTEVGEKVGLGWDAAMDFESDVLNAVNQDLRIALPLASSVFRLILRTQLAPLAPAANSLVADATQQAPAAPTAGQPAYAWITVTVPADAGMMAFDFTVTGDPVEDKIACAINDQNVFTLPAKFAPDGKPVSTDMMDVSAYAGQSIELFFGLAGGTSTNCQLAIDGLRFVTVPAPKVGVAILGANAAVKWPAAASGWVLESSETLAIGSWQPVPLGSGPAAQSGVLSIQEAVTGLKKFYRLRRSP